MNVNNTIKYNNSSEENNLAITSNKTLDKTNKNKESDDIIKSQILASIIIILIYEYKTRLTSRKN